jgi:hypothetical protein
MMAVRRPECSGGASNIIWSFLGFSGVEWRSSAKYCTPLEYLPSKKLEFLIASGADPVAAELQSEAQGRHSLFTVGGDPSNDDRPYPEIDRPAAQA